MVKMNFSSKNTDETKQSLLEKITIEIKMQLEEEYLMIVDKIEKNDDSTDGNVFIIYSKNKKYVIKVYDNLAHTKSMIELHTMLISSGLNVPKIIVSKTKATYKELSNKRYMVVYSFMEGSQISWNQFGKIDDFIIIQTAQFLSKLHSLTNGENSSKLPELPFKDMKNVNRFSVLHFDLTKSNIFVNKATKNEIGFIDFDDAKYGPSVYDVAIAITNLFFSKTHGVDIDGVYKFIDEYYGKELELKNKEIPLIKTFALQWIDYILDGNDFDTSTTESFTVKKKLINEKLLL